MDKEHSSRRETASWWVFYWKKNTISEHMYTNIHTLFWFLMTYYVNLKLHVCALYVGCILITLSYCEFWILWVGLNTKFTIWHTLDNFAHHYSDNPYEAHLMLCDNIHNKNYKKKPTITFNCILLQCTEETQCQRRMAELWGGVLLSNNKRKSNQRIFCDVIFNLKQNTRLKCTFKGSYSCAVTVTVGGCLVMFCVTSAQESGVSFIQRRCLWPLSRNGLCCAIPVLTQSFWFSGFIPMRTALFRHFLPLTRILI